MSKLYTAKELERMLKNGESLATVPANAKLTPMARDILRQHRKNGHGHVATAPAAAASAANAPRIHEPILPDAEYNWTPGADPKSAAQLEKFFYSPEIQALKDRICHIGKRIWNKGYVDGNGGNITVRVGDNLVLCTPTLISKGFKSPEPVHAPPRSTLTSAS
jgi:L-fuculose-phosphate aldolase